MQINRTGNMAAFLPESDRRLPPGAAILVIGGMSVALWSAIIAAAIQLL
ncbi:MAG TPA: hypothetical protein VJ770_10520 [Stellaceae bacterium]|nr:hypothetical protein [Stellaceae bacterium]